MSISIDDFNVESIVYTITIGGVDMTEENIIFGKKIRTLRQEQKLSREKLAENAGISTQFLADIETGKKGMSAVTLKKLCVALHISSDYIIFDKEVQNYNLSAMLASIPESKKEGFESVVQMMIRLLD